MSSDFEHQKQALRQLQAAGVPFVIVGGHAVAFHGYVRGTEDVDVVWRRSPESEAALVHVLKEMNAAWLAKDLDPATGLERAVPVTASYVQAHHLMILSTRWGYLDLFDYVPGLPNADVNEFFGESVVDADGFRYCSYAWLRRMKEAAGRTKDRLDLDELGEVNQ